jgi:hypothetical protein
MSGTSPEKDVIAARREHLIPGREIHMHDLAGYRFCEVGLITGVSEDGAIANVWNTTGASHPRPEQVDALKADIVARENGALRAWLDPVRQWLVDDVDVWEAGDDRSFGDITATWVGAADAATVTQTRIQGYYDPGYMYRNSTFTFRKGSEVYVLDAPDGEAFVLESFTDHWDPSLTVDSLAHLGSRLALADGWGFRTEVLERDMKVTPVGDGNRAHMMQDNLHNVYQGSDAGRAFSDICRMDSLS